jgi:hypothetical protein
MNEALDPYLPTVLVQLVGQYYTTFQSTPDISHITFQAVLLYISKILTYIDVINEHSAVLYQCYDYHLRVWVSVHRYIRRRQFALFGLLVLHRAAPTVLSRNKQRLPVPDLILNLLRFQYTIEEVASMNELLDHHTIEPIHCQLYDSITSVYNDACLNADFSVRLLLPLLGRSVIDNYTLAETLLAWIFTVAQRRHIKIKLSGKWMGQGANARPRFNHIPLNIFYGIGPVRKSQMNAQTIGTVDRHQLKPKFVPYSIWHDLCQFLSGS